MNIENINIPPRPYRCNVLRPVLSINGMVTSVIFTIITPIPIVTNLATFSAKPAVMNRLVE